MKKILLTAAIIVLAIVIIFSWIAWNSAQFGVAHVIGLAATLLLLLVIWVWPSGKQSNLPPP